MLKNLKRQGNTSPAEFLRDSIDPLRVAKTNLLATANKTISDKGQPQYTQQLQAAMKSVLETRGQSASPAEQAVLAELNIFVENLPSEINAVKSNGRSGLADSNAVNILMLHGSAQAANFNRLAQTTLGHANETVQARQREDASTTRENTRRTEQVAHLGGMGEQASRSTEQLTAAGLRKQVLDLFETRKKDASEEEKAELEKSSTWFKTLSDSELHEHATYISHNREHFADKESMLKHREGLRSGEQEREGRESKGRGSVMLIDTLVGLGFKVLAH